MKNLNVIRTKCTKEGTENRAENRRPQIDLFVSLFHNIIIVNLILLTNIKTRL